MRTALALALAACSSSLTSGPGLDASQDPHALVTCRDGSPCERACSTSARQMSFWCAAKQVECDGLEWNGVLGCCETVDGVMRFEVCQ